MASQYVVANSQTRSRSPSPCSRRFEDSGNSFKEDDPDGSGFLQPDQGHRHSRRRRSRSRTASHPHHVDVQVTVANTGDSQADPDDSTQLLNSSRGPTSRRDPLNREMDDLASAIRNYGSFSSDSGNVNNSDVPKDVAHHNHNHTNKAKFERQKSYYTPAMVDELRKRNKLYFLDPITKLLNFHGFPWKLTLQIIKLVLITIQVIIFGGQRENIVEYFERSDLTYKHLLLKDWSTAYETLPYPPAAGDYAIYSMPELFDHMNYVMKQYYQLPELSLAKVNLFKNKTTHKNLPIDLCFRANSFVEYDNGSYIVSADVMHNCTTVKRLSNHTYDIKEYLKLKNFTLPFNRTLDITLKFHIRTFHLNLLETHYGPTCYDMHISVIYTNSERSGQLLVDLLTKPEEIECEGKIMSPEAQDEQDKMKVKVIAFDAVVIVVCCFSTILCSRSLKRSNKLRQDTATFFKIHKGRPLSFSNHMEYINMWYILIICNDILTVVGSSFKIQLETRVFSVSSENYAVCSILLGGGVFLTYVGILRYLGFFKSYNILILTLKTSFPHVLRFLFCAICLYAGFLFCGWVVFSPYHIKFRKLSTTSECLFALVNGDDMYVTFSSLNPDTNDAIWYFHRVYLYVFIALFIYVVISVFIAVIMDNYENLKHYYEDGFPDTEIQAFIKEDGEMSISELFRHVERSGRWQSWFFCIFPCLACLRNKKVPYKNLEYELKV
ncbi:mucolipin-3-like isoform X2 [Physella acuta]|uniref:mucolipin-3-like isoform X2 n=1 Tax=Physella acuta TaxID=109671 RepID=UPI0027DDE4C4|nr:mucolipin-3-like isoform X2 [Physella acuta]XP_059162838.1 mucolipin-3-like isoform X2 [Physella acuta]